MIFGLSNTRTLVDLLKRGLVPKNEKVKCIIVLSIALVLSVFDGANENGFCINLCASMLAVSVAVLLCYHINKRYDNKRFAERIVCMSVAVGIRLGIPFLLVIILYAFWSGDYSFKSPYGVGLRIMLEILFLTILVVKFGKDFKHGTRS